ncbi:phytoene desaturase family protein [Halorientalis brevis]|uniref:Phytoene desaturase family protein n=1 Tax=Halorientalis brevis TaxID=1126241 RepID=A0ABD6C8Y3_9EURY|nr:NAD(P)/FAD-dependent oxidoreductase [Halorientalis brevis]
MHDTIVVGAGLGGLTAGAKLATAGQDVLVLEKHTIPGGYATTFQRGECEFEVSLHEIDGLDEGDAKREVFAELGVFDAVEFEPVPNYRVRHGDGDVTLPHGREAMEAALVEAFPEEAAGIERFFDVVCRIREEISEFPMSGGSLRTLLTAPFTSPTLLRYRKTTLGEFLDSLVDDERLKLLLSFNYAYYNDDPYTLALPFFAAGQGSYLAGGGHYVKGGSQALSDHLASVVEDAGGSVELGRLVTDILVEDGRATGVRHEKTNTGTDARTDRARTVVANGAIPNVAEHLLPDPHGADLHAEIGDFERGPSLTTLYLAFETPLCELGNDHYSTFVVDESVDALSETATNSHASFGRRSFAFVDYSQVAADLAPEGQSTGTVATLDEWDNWAGLTDEEYRQKKAHVKDVLLRRLDEQIPGAADAVAHAELATPKTMHRYTRNPGGAVYGFAQTPSQSLLNRQIRAPVSDLYFASAWSFPGGGFSGAILSGYGAASNVLQRDSRAEPAAAD